MMLKKLLVVNIIFCCLCCKPTQQTNINSDNDIQQCFIVEETFDNTSMKIFLESTKNNRELIDKFLKDNSELAFLSIINNKAIFANKENNQWMVSARDSNVPINDTALSSRTNAYANLNAVYKLSCPENYAVFGSNNGFQAFWIKKSGAIKFLYYSTTYDMSKLVESDRQKVISLMEINDVFEKAKE